MKQYLLTTLENSKTYTLAVAAAMPEESYGFKPAPGVWNFLEQMHHIAYGIGWWKENFIEGRKTDWLPTPVKANKQEVTDYIIRAYAELSEAVEKAKPGDELVKGFHSTLDHITHHRGQAIIYLRSKGQAVPEYLF